jgi:TRAP-type C4-dicarboxylate transport system permease small subunit
MVSGYVAAVCLVCIALTILAQICGRFVGIAIDSTESAGFLLAGTSFFGLAYTFRHGAHIRVTLLTQFTHGLFARLMHLWAISFTAVVIGYLCWWSFDLVYFSFEFGDTSPGLLAIPFWIPRSAMALGTLVFLVSLLDEFVAVLRGAVPSYVANAETLFPVDGEPADTSLTAGDSKKGATR